MHINEGVLAAPVLVAGAVAAAGCVAAGMKQLDDESLVKTAVVSSALFVATLIRVPVGPSSVHLILSGLAGLLLGWRVFPAFAIALVLQTILFGIGGLSTLGVNIMILAVPGIIVYYLFRVPLTRSGHRRALALGGIAGCTSIVAGVCLLAVVLISTGREFTAVAGAVSLAHIAVMVVEGLVTGATVGFLKRVRPESFAVAGERPAPVGEAA